jgi:hypothetical protein
VIDLIVSFAIGDCGSLCFDTCVFIYIYMHVIYSFNSKSIQPNRMTLGGMTVYYPVHRWFDFGSYRLSRRL